MATVDGTGDPGVQGIGVGQGGNDNADGVQGFGSGTFSGVAGFGDTASNGTGVFGLGRGPGAPGVRGIGSGGNNTVPSSPAGVYGQGGTQGVEGTDVGPGPGVQGVGGTDQATGVLGTSAIGTGVVGSASGDDEFARGVAGLSSFGIGGDFTGGGNGAVPVGFSGPIGVRASAVLPDNGESSRQGIGVLASSSGGTAVQALSTGGSAGIFSNSSAQPSVPNINPALVVTATGGGAAAALSADNPQSGFAVLEVSVLGAGHAALFTGDVKVAGTLTATTKQFVIDHPLDPANKYLAHASVESSEQATIYSGNAVLDDRGEAVVNLPAWVEALNEDFRYQLTCVGRSAPVYVADEVAHNHFRIAGGSAGMKVSWQLTGIRKDAWAKSHPLVVEQDKSEGEKGIAPLFDSMLQASAVA
jgi:hypothetical protein